uniref:Secreted protein n=1 Tax=Steinernema glaseri TaxID=37863 RepID=A0A1I7YA38_9BILA
MDVLEACALFLLLGAEFALFRRTEHAAAVKEEGLANEPACIYRSKTALFMHSCMNPATIKKPLPRTEEHKTSARDLWRSLGNTG